jgi:hypothetical protein
MNKNKLPNLPSGKTLARREKLGSVFVTPDRNTSI